VQDMQLRLPIDPAASGLRVRPPTLGEHSAEVLAELGYTASEMAAFTGLITSGADPS
jgi:crotonobetainyl-CoA:carnitine CoA-transferase CaiB-like acyl-CoA transferase